jgi:hypothetical protein
MTEAVAELRAPFASRDLREPSREVACFSHGSSGPPEKGRAARGRPFWIVDYRRIAECNQRFGSPRQ